MSSTPAAPPLSPPSQEAPERATLGRSLARSIAWTGGLKWGSQVFTWVSTIIVARLLTPEDYGLVGMATVYLGLVTVISEFGLAPAIVTLRDLTADQIRQVNTVVLCSGVALFVLSVGAAVPLSRFFGAPELQPVVVVMSLAFVIKAFRIVPNALLQKELRFKLIALIETTWTLVMALSMVIFAWLGFRYWTLVIGGLIGEVIASGLTLVWRRSGFKRPRLEPLREVFAFSWHMQVSHVSWYIYSTADFTVAGRLLGKGPLGAYTFAWQLAVAFPAKITDVVTRVASGYFSAVQDDPAALRRFLLRLSEGIALLTLPVTIGLALVADDFVLLVLGEKWAPAIAPLRALAAYAAVRSLSPLPARVLMVTGEARFLMYNNLLEMLLLVPAFYFGGLQWGTIGIAVAWVIIDPLVVQRIFRRVFERIDLSVGQYVRSIWPAFSSTLMMALVVLAVRHALPATCPLVARFSLQVAAGAATYSAGMWLLHRESVRDMISMVRRMRS